MVAVQSPAEPIPGYQLLERLGQGGFGEVWKARAPGGILKAIKIVHGCLDGNSGQELCVRQELKALERVKSVRHPYILSLERYDIIEGQLFIVMELADRSLWDRFQECRAQNLPGIPRDELLRYMVEIAEALDLMNREYQLQHLDIKPQNLFLLYNHIKVGDFGLVKGLEGMQARVTSGVTPVYAAPETYEGVVSRFCDQYSLAIVYQELLTGQVPFPGRNPQQLMMQHLKAAPNLDLLPPDDREAIARALAKKPDERHANCGDLVRALRKEGIPAADPPEAKRPLKAQSPSPPDAFPDRDRQTLPFHSGERSREPQVISTPASPPLPPERREETGEGVLLPALVIGLGGAGLGVLQQLRAALHKRVGPADLLPHIRFLHLDTDPGVLVEAAQGVPETQVREKEIFLARLQRPAHYLKPGHEQQSIQGWFPLLKLKDLPRDQVTTRGWRALGRLAVAGQYAAIAARLRAELEACTKPAAFTEAIERTGLGLRSNRPRVYIVAHLGGGTGSGMFLDLAYGLRRLLAEMGQPRSELVGVFFLPPAGRQAPAQAAANAFAALTELNQFAQGTPFSAGYIQHEERPNERGPAFSRCFLLPQGDDSSGAGSLQEMTALAGDFLCRDMTTALGRTADQCRPASNGSTSGLSAFGSYWFTVPHRLLLQRVAQRFCLSLVQSWQSEHGEAQEHGMRAWIDQQFQRAQLTASDLGERLKAACAQSLGQSPEEACAALLGEWAPGGKADLRRDPRSASRIFKNVEQLIGAPGESAATVLGQALATAAEDVAEDAHGRLAEIVLSALWVPEFRMAASPGDVLHRQLSAALADLAKQHQALAAEQIRHAEKVLKAMAPLLDTLRKRSFLGWGQKSRAAAEMLDWLRDYLQACCQGLLFRHIGLLYQDLHDNLHKHQRDVGCCRPRITQFLRSFEDAAAVKSHVDLGLGQYLLPPGCRTLDEGADQVLKRLTPEELDSLHKQVHDLIGRRLQEHLHVCTAPAQFFKDLQEAIYRQVASFTESQLTRAHAAEIYLQRHAADPAVLADLAGAFEEAGPLLMSRSDDKEVSILAVPAGPEGEYFRGLVHQALPGEEFVNATSTDDIVFYREQPNLKFTDLPQLGPAAEEAYRQFLAGDRLNPHARTDVTWRPIQR